MDYTNLVYIEVEHKKGPWSRSAPRAFYIIQQIMLAKINRVGYTAYIYISCTKIRGIFVG